MSDGVAFIEARHYTPTGGRAIDLIVVHDMEAPEAVDTAENVANWFASDSAPQASAHRCFDQDSEVQCVQDQDVAWHAPGVNHRSLGYEHAGYAAFSRDDWSGPESAATLQNSAARARIDCNLYGLPVEFVDADGILNNARGITTHAEVTKAYPRQGNHTDPGPNFPMDLYLSMIGGSAGTIPSTPTAPAAAPDKTTTGRRTLRVGSVGDDVRALQGLLIIGGCGPLASDGVFGQETRSGVMCWQEKLGVTMDGIVGPQTQAATDAFFQFLATTAPAPAAGPSWPGVVLRYPPVLSDPSAATWQAQMAQRGWWLAADGQYGPTSRGVCIAFQQDKGLGVDGMVGPQTWDAAWSAPV